MRGALDALLNPADLSFAPVTPSELLISLHLLVTTEAGKTSRTEVQKTKTKEYIRFVYTRQKTSLLWIFGVGNVNICDQKETKRILHLIHLLNLQLLYLLLQSLQLLLMGVLQSIHGA